MLYCAKIIEETDLKRRRMKSEDRKMKEIEMTKMVEEMDLRNLTPEVDMTDLVIATPDINRPALQLTGYYEHFANERVQIIGYVEFTYLQHLEESERVRAFEEFVSRKIPCVIFTTKMIPGPEILELCNRYQVPAFAVDKSTSVFMAEIIRWLNVQLAPMISIHGVLVDVFGEGVLIMGESGIGKSEAALELIKRGHRLVSDDVVEISRVSDITLVGTAPDITRHFIELFRRGSGGWRCRPSFRAPHRAQSGPGCRHPYPRYWGRCRRRKRPCGPARKAAGGPFSRLRTPAATLPRPPEILR